MGHPHLSMTTRFAPKRALLNHIQACLKAVDFPCLQKQLMSSLISMRCASPFGSSAGRTTMLTSLKIRYKFGLSFHLSMPGDGTSSHARREWASTSRPTRGFQMQDQHDIVRMLLHSVLQRKISLVHPENSRSLYRSAFEYELSAGGSIHGGKASEQT